MRLDADEVITDDGATIRLWACSPENATSATVFVHGATYSGRSIFALEANHVDDISWLQFAAEEGQSSYAIDLCGYGDSDIPPEFDDAPNASAPLVRAPTAAKDVATVLKRLQPEYDHLHLVGYSWGTIICGRLAATNPNFNVSSLTQFAPIYDPSDVVGKRFNPGNPPEAYRCVSKDQIADSWNGQLPEDAPPQTYRGGTEEVDPVLDAFWETLYCSNQGTKRNGKEYILAPNGALIDIYTAAIDGPHYSAEEISIPTLVVRGTRDTVSTRTDALCLYDLLSDRLPRRYVEISDGTHFLPLEARRHTLYETISQFQQYSRDH